MWVLEPTRFGSCSTLCVVFKFQGLIFLVILTARKIDFIHFISSSNIESDSRYSLRPIQYVFEVFLFIALPCTLFRSADTTCSENKLRSYMDCFVTLSHYLSCLKTLIKDKFENVLLCKMRLSATCHELLCLPFSRFRSREMQVPWLDLIKKPKLRYP